MSILGGFGKWHGDEDMGWEMILGRVAIGYKLEAWEAQRSEHCIIVFSIPVIWSCS